MLPWAMYKVYKSSRPSNSSPRVSPAIRPSVLCLPSFKYILYVSHTRWLDHIYHVIFKHFQLEGGGQGVHLIRILNAGSGLLGLHCVRFVVLCAGRYGAKFTLNFINADPALLGYFVDFVFCDTRARRRNATRQPCLFVRRRTRPRRAHTSLRRDGNTTEMSLRT